MTDTTASAPAPGLLSRLIGVIVSPKATFQNIVPAPKVLGAILVAGLVIGLSQGLPRLTESGKQAALDAQVKQTERFTGQPVSEEQYARMRQFAPITAYVTMVASPIGVGVIVLIFSGLYFVIFNVILGGTASFKQVASVVAHSSIISALGAAIGAPVQYFQGTANPMGPFTLSALLPMLDENSFVARFLGFIGVFSIWGIIVTAIGLGVLYRRKTGNIAIGLFLLTAVFAAAGAAITGMFTR
jgi:Yip1 domain